jgi:ABC-2 type transport system ATP-binding protein
MQQKFFDLILQENKKGATVLFSSHILNEVQKLCHRVAIIKEGRIIKVENISTLNENNYKKFKVEITSHVDKAYFNISGINNLTIKNNIVSFLFRGDINDMVEKLHGIKIANLWIEEPSLEEIFMHYYKKEE